MSDVKLDPNRWRCRECGWRGDRGELLIAPNPFIPNNKELLGCPVCNGINCVDQVCDVGGCWEPYTCGWPSERGYRLTCGTHMREQEGGL